MNEEKLRHADKTLQQEQMKKSISVIYRDSARHKETVDNMVLDIEKSAKNEY